MHMRNKRRNYLNIIGVILIAGNLSCAIAADRQQTQKKLQQLNVKINNLLQNLTHAQDEREQLHKKLSTTEKKISEGVRTLRSIQRTKQKNEQKITSLQNKIDQLNQDLVTQQQLLAKHIRARYQMGEYQALKWLINQNDPHTYSRVLNYYAYIVTSRQQLIDEIKEKQTNLNQNQQTLRKEVAKNKHLQKQLSQNQQQLIKNKSLHTNLIQSLNDDIHSKKHELQEFKKNKRALSNLLKSLAKRSVVQANKSFELMRGKLPLPVQTTRKSLRRMNQGVTFFAEEGSEVSAVYPGKVVFSDWLKGYGLLLIIDHGQGFMTLYAHNQSLFKRKDETVQQGEQIATVGHSGGIRQNGLYFEVRMKGKAISPFDWLS